MDLELELVSVPDVYTTSPILASNTKKIIKNLGLVQKSIQALKFKHPAVN